MNGTGRYICKFSNGIHFWSRNADVVGKTAFDLDKWQMITATSDGTTVKLYKNDKKTPSSSSLWRMMSRSSRSFPRTPGEEGTFQGEREFTVWNSCLPESIKVLQQSFMPAGQ